MKILLLGDQHGKVPEIEFSGFDLVLATGDFCPIGGREHMFRVVKERMKNPSYSRNWYDLVGKERAVEIIRSDLEAGRKVLEKLDSLGVPVLAVPGNADYFSKRSGLAFESKNHYQDLLKNLRNVKDCHLRLETVDGFQVIGYGNSTGRPEYPQDDEETRLYSPEALALLESEYRKDTSAINSLFRKAAKPVILLSHNVPFGSRLDIIKMKGSPRYGKHFGSVVIGEAVKKHQPLALVGGHMHELTGTDMAGKTLCINVGTGTAVLEVSGKGVESLDFHQKPYYSP